MHSCKSFSSPYVLCSVLAESLQVCGIALTNGLIKISLKLGESFVTDSTAVTKGPGTFRWKTT